ncbi:type III pantothenate kinase [Blattabacterium cuenoti]|uniref:type III pantothenate kinase n=1 Tax=Blattabacterium cuenoti TaxID=1653831 RepID=UPI00163BEC54|nr:type III pantothenate kinase [Blattabacterium cuenoti]
MLLIINIGNSNIRFGIFIKKQFNFKCYCSWIINSKPYRQLNEYVHLFINIYNKHNIIFHEIKNIVIGSVVPELTGVIKYSLYIIHKIYPIIMDRYSVSPIKHHYNQLGTDLYANAIAGYTLYKKKFKNILIIDFGTALSLICVDPYGIIKGIIIAPGVNSSLMALIANTSLLSNENEIELKNPPILLGKNTIDCIQSGLIYGYLGMVEGFINRINKELKTKCLVISTGGQSHIYSPLTKKIHYNDILHTIKGLKILFNIKYGI